MQDVKEDGPPGLPFPPFVRQPPAEVSYHVMVRKINTSEKLRTTLPLGDTDACRLVDGAGDDLPGIFLDDFAGHRLLSTTAPTLSPELENWATSLAPSITTYWKHLDQQAREAPSLVAGTKLTKPFEIHEIGIRYLASFQSGYSQGIFLDHRCLPTLRKPSIEWPQRRRTFRSASTAAKSSAKRTPRCMPRP